MARRDEQFDERFLRKLEYLHIMSKKIAAGQARAQRKTRIVGSGLEFADHRNYSPGDDMRNIDWKVYGRTNKLFLKLFEEEEDLYIYFLLDTSKSMTLGFEPTKWDYAKQCAAALGYIGLSNLDRVSIIPFSAKLDGRMPPTRGKAQIFKRSPALRVNRDYDVHGFVMNINALYHTLFNDSLAVSRIDNT